jgi:hypothetical protein
MKKFSGKFDFNNLLRNRKMRPVILALVFTLAFCVFVTSTLFAGSSYIPEDNVQELNYERSQVYVDGTGYVLEDYTKKQHEEEEEERAIIRQEETPQKDEEEEETKNPTYTPPSSYSRNYSGISSYSRSSSNYRPRYTSPRPSNQNTNTKKKKEKAKKEKKSEYEKEKEEVNVKPTIKIGGVKKGDTVKGTTKKFTVKATSYDGDDITGSKLTVKMNGVKLTPVSDNTYTGDVIDGDNKIEVKAVDGEGNSKTKTVKFKGITEDEPEIIGDLNVSVTAEVLGLDVIVDESTVDIYDSESLSDVVKRYFKESDVSTETIGGDDHYELERINIDGILDDIPDDIVEELEEQGISIPDDKDSLGLNDFGPGSGWMYKVDGSAPNKYMDKVNPKDGSTVEIYYTISGMD